MTDTVVFFLPYSAGHAHRIAAFLNADKRQYSRQGLHEAFSTYRNIVAVMSAGIVVRALAPLIRNKWDDPAVVVISPDLRYAVPLLGGHHGANALAKELAKVGLIPVITTATETVGREAVEMMAERTASDILNRDSTRTVNAAILEGDVPVYAVPGPGVVIAGPGVSILLGRGEYVVGIGCRKGIAREEVTAALSTALSDAGIERGMVLAYATTEKKKGETGLQDAVADLNGNLVFLDDLTINAEETVSPSRASDLGLKGVAEPCALALSRHRDLILPKRVYGGVTVAIAR
jgi:cobalt-precorrin 5A hydrolase